MNMFGWFKRQPLTPPLAVIQAARACYGLSTEQCCAVQTEKLDTLSDNVWLVKFNEQAQALVAYTPEEDELALAIPWYVE